MEVNISDFMGLDDMEFTRRYAALKKSGVWDSLPHSVQDEWERERARTEAAIKRRMDGAAISACEAASVGLTDVERRVLREQLLADGRDLYDSIDRIFPAPVCHVCGWIHDDKLTAWALPDSSERLTVTDGCDRHQLLVYLHDGMTKSGGDVSLAEFMKEYRADGKRPTDILGHELHKRLFQSTGRDRGKIRIPGLVRKPGRPKNHT